MSATPLHVPERNAAGGDPRLRVSDALPRRRAQLTHGKAAHHERHLDHRGTVVGGTSNPGYRAAIARSASASGSSVVAPNFPRRVWAPWSSAAATTPVPIPGRALKRRR